jgi:hypothetical protein
MENTRQSLFFSYIAEKYYHPNPATLAKDLQEHLCLSRQAIYKRIKGKTPLNIAEVEQLLMRYEVQIDILFPNAKNCPPPHQFNKLNICIRAITGRIAV